jgi:hypothetical protein
MLRFYGT